MWIDFTELAFYVECVNVYGNAEKFKLVNPNHFESHSGGQNVESCAEIRLKVYLGVWAAF